MLVVRVLFGCGYLRAVLERVGCGEEYRQEEKHGNQKSRVELGFHLGKEGTPISLFFSTVSCDGQLVLSTFFLIFKRMSFVQGNTLLNTLR